MANYLDSLDVIDANNNIENVLLQDRGAMSLISGLIANKTIKNIKEFGVLPDNADNSTALSALAPDVYYVPEGNYIFDGTVNVSDLILIGENKDTIFTRKSGDFNISDSELHNISFIDEIAASGNYGLVNGSNVLIENCYFETSNNAHIAIAIAGSQNSNSAVLNTEVNGENGGMFGVYSDNDLGVLTVEGCIIHDFYLNGIFSSAKVGRYIGNTIYNNHKQSTPTYGGQIDVLSNTQAADSIHYICGNYIHDPGASEAYAIETYQTSAVIQSNFIEGSYPDSNNIVIQNSIHNVIENNIIKYGRYGILFNANACGNVVGNKFDTISNGCVRYLSGLNYYNDVRANICNQNTPLLTYANNVPLINGDGALNTIYSQVAANNSLNFELSSDSYKNQSLISVLIIRDNVPEVIYIERGTTILRPSPDANSSISISNNVLTITNTGNEASYAVRSI